MTIPSEARSKRLAAQLRHEYDQAMGWQGAFVALPQDVQSALYRAVAHLTLEDDRE